jgi:hypothetical protein
MHEEPYVNQLEQNLPFYDLYLNDYIKRLEFCRDNGCNTIMLTGNIEPQQNKRFLADFGLMLRLMERPFRNIEMQTTGVTINEAMLRFLRNHVGVNTIALSLWAMDDKINWDYRGRTFDDFHFMEFCQSVNKYDFNLRLCLNLTGYFDRWDIDTLFTECRKLGADQVTLRKLYHVDINDCVTPLYYDELKEYITGGKWKPIQVLETGKLSYSVKGMSVVIDNDCMAEEHPTDSTFKYLILRPNGKLYGAWNDPASLIF